MAKTSNKSMWLNNQDGTLGQGQRGLEVIHQWPMLQNGVERLHIISDAAELENYFKRDGDNLKLKNLKGGQHGNYLKPL